MAIIKVKNNINSELSITHADNKPAKSIVGTDIAVAVNTINDFPLGASDGDTVIVRDLNRGGTFIYDSAEVANDNQSTNFNGWIRQSNFSPNSQTFINTNTGYGKDSLISYTGTIGFNTCIGYLTSSKLVSGGNNTSLGSRAHYQNISGNNSVAIGDSSHRNFGVDGSSPAYNVAIGIGSMYVKSNGSNNTAVGADSFGSFKDSTDRGIGDASGVYHDWEGNVNTGGSFNTAIGQNALTYSSGDGNSAVGSGSGVYATTGSYNTLVGESTGAMGAPSTSGNFLHGGSYNTFIGYKSSPSYLAKDSSYMTALGAEAVVTTANTITLGRTNDVVVIGQTGRINNSTTTGANLQLDGGVLLQNGNATGKNVLDYYSEESITPIITGITFGVADNSTMDITRIGNVAFFNILIKSNGSTTSATSASITNLPWAAKSQPAIVGRNLSTGASIGGSIYSTTIYIGNYGVTGGAISLSGTYIVA